MTKEQKEIVLLGSRFETMNKYIDLSQDDGTISKGIAKAMQEYAERYHHAKVKENELLHGVSGSFCMYCEKQLKLNEAIIICKECTE